MAPQQIAHYRITSKLGEGGMGAVYRATDTKLNRDVAVKILPEALAADSDYLARFTREAQVLAALNHPNIAAVYGVEDGAIVMELVEGQNLPVGLSLEDAVPIACQIAQALEAAHEKGIVHRDLKPANIKLTPEGSVKVLDFGLATAPDHSNSSGNLSASPTLTIRATQAGVIMGTAAYMSPEQAAGKPVDKRADIWAFGVVFYEVLTGRQLFSGDSISHILAGVLKDPIDLSLVPEPVRPLLARCLDRDLRTRLRDIGEARIWLSRPLPDTTAVAAVPTAGSRGPWLAAAVCALAAAVLAFLHFREAPRKTPGRVRFEISVPPSGSVGRFVSLSPDGQTLAWADAGNIYVRAINGFETRVLAAARLDGYMFWSPDSKQLGFQADGSLKRVAVAGVPVQNICDRVPALGTVWTKDDWLIVGANSAGLLRVRTSGGTPEPVKVNGIPSDVTAITWPVLLPGNRLIFTAVKGQRPAALLVADFQADGNLSHPRELLTVRQGAQYITDAAGRGYLLFVRGTSLMAQAFDPETATLSGEAVVITDAVGIYLTRGFFAAANGGVIVFRTGETTGNRPEFVDRSGKSESVLSIPASLQDLTISPDGRSILTSLRKGDEIDNIWVLDPTRGAHTRLTMDDVSAARPIWSPDGRRVAYFGDGLWIKPADGNGAAQKLADAGMIAWSWSHDGKEILVSGGLRPDWKTGLFRIALDGDHKPVPFLESKFYITQAQFSPDDHWVAYVSQESGEAEVYVQRFPGGGERIRISNTGGVQPRWRRDGRELFYVEPRGKMMAVALRYGKTLEPDAPVALFDARLSSYTNGTSARYDVTPDGKHFCLSRFPESQSTRPLRVIVNWKATAN